MRRVIFCLSIVAVATMATGALAADQGMAQRLGQYLHQSGQLSNYKIGVKYLEGGVVWLEGRVASEQQRATAMRLIQNVQGVNHVVDRLSVAPGATGQLASAASPVAAQMSAHVPRGVPAPPRPIAMASMGAALAAPAAAMGQMPMGAAGQGPVPVGNFMQGNPAVTPARYDQPQMPGYAWPSYAASPNYAAVTYPKQYSPTAWPYIGPFYPYPQVPLGWRKVTLQWDDGWWWLDFKNH